MFKIIKKITIKNDSSDIPELYENKRLLKEIQMANIFKDSITDVDWVRSKKFSPGGAAANYSFLYILFRVLNDVKPLDILEFGIGQTTRLTSQYVNFKTPEARLTIIEHDKLWIDVFKEDIPQNNVNIVNLEMQEIEFFNKFKTKTYKDLGSVTTNQKYDLILLDGPYGSVRYSRPQILDLIQHNLSNSFVIIIDDCDRAGEKEMAELVVGKLSRMNIYCDYSIYSGVKDQYVIYSSNLSFLKTL